MQKHRTCAACLSMACGLVMACDVLAYTFDVAVGGAVAQHQSSGQALTWAAQPVPISLELGDTWDDEAASALLEWSAVLPVLTIQEGAPNVVRWARADEPMGAVVATTQREYETVSGRRAIVRTTTLLNPELCWDSYEGPVRLTFCGGQLMTLLDVRRVVLHELGHVLGLEHPDEGGQHIDAIMNKDVSDRDTLAADDIAGIERLYPPMSAGVQRQDVAVPAVGHSGGAGGGCAIGSNGEMDGAMAFLLVALLAHWVAARVVAWRR